VTRATRTAAALLVALALAGCARGGLVSRPGMPPGRLLVLARLPAVENRGIGDRAAELVAQGLRPSGEVWTVNEFVLGAAAAGARGWALGLVERLGAGGWPTADERVELLRFAVTGLVVTEVTEYEQVWGKYAKFTRAGVEAHAFDVAAGSTVWRLHRAVEIEDVRGRAFAHAIESAVGELVAAVQPGTPFSVIDLWRAWRR
jgi:hypothetical protein